MRSIGVRSRARRGRVRLANEQNAVAGLTDGLPQRRQHSEPQRDHSNTHPEPPRPTRMSTQNLTSSVGDDYTRFMRKLSSKFSRIRPIFNATARQSRMPEPLRKRHRSGLRPGSKPKLARLAPGLPIATKSFIFIDNACASSYSGYDSYHST